MNSKPTEELQEKPIKLYNQLAIGIATFIGGPMAAGYLIRENFRNLNHPKLGDRALVISIIATIVLFGSIFFIPEKIIDYIPNQIIPIAYTAIIYFIVEKMQGYELKQHKEFNNEFYSRWRAAGIGAISMLIILIVGVGVYFAIPESQAVKEYYIEMDKFHANENEGNAIFEMMDTSSYTDLLIIVDSICLPKWKHNIEIIQGTSAISDLPDDLIARNKTMLEYSELRVKWFQLYRKYLIDEHEAYFHHAQLEQINSQIDEIIEELNSESIF